MTQAPQGPAVQGTRPPEAAPALRLDAATRHFGRKAVVAGVTLDVAAGQAVVVRGANGAGKTTLLRMAALRLAPTSGRVAVAGADARGDQRARGAIAYVPQTPALADELTPTEHLRWWAGLHGRDASAAAAARSLADAGLGACAHRPAATLSRGQRQRLAIAVALHVPAAILILDEPYASLDEAGRIWLAQRLSERAAAGAAILMALHETDPHPPGARLVHLASRRAACATRPHDGPAEGHPRGSPVDPGAEASP